ncbi:asparaginase [Novosphingobium rosa]|uniref:asparaginase n=1 Tax=Novosphingobium rosa TaxID=76978 RepID=UPI00082E7E37|nr:asparaginase [Novosphingobium rosa]
MSLPRVALIGTGGTFAMVGRHDFDWVEYGESGIVQPIDALVGAARGWGLADLRTVDFRQLGSTGITPGDWLDLYRLLRGLGTGTGAPEGCVITHGTATLEETAFFLSLVWRGSMPVVLTGAQRPPNTAGSDAQANLRGAIAVAASPLAQGLGVLVVIDNLVFAARDVAKTSSGALDAFEAPQFGPLGRVEADGTLVLRHRPAPLRDPLDLADGLEGAQSLPRVDMALSYAGADGAAIDAFVAAGAQGIVSAGLLPGRPANGEQAAIARAVAAGVSVVQATRGLRGNVVPQAFLDRAGVIPAGDLDAAKARIVLMLGLMRTRDPQRLKQAFAAY